VLVSSAFDNVTVAVPALPEGASQTVDVGGGVLNRRRGLHRRGWARIPSAVPTAVFSVVPTASTGYWARLATARLIRRA
jgi:hypothetical protein